MQHDVSNFDQWVDLASERLGGAVLYANDDFFAEKENLLKPTTPVFIDGKYTDRGKWMDGWESRRRREEGHDDAIIRLGAPGVVRGVIVDTAHFKGNFPESASLEACTMPPNATVAELLAATWTEIAPRTRLAGDTKNELGVRTAVRATHVRLHIFPDGGVARLRVFGDVAAEPSWMGREGQVVDLASVENGAVVVGCNDMFFGSRHNLIMPGRSVNMGDGWETKRSRKQAPDWLLLRLAAEGTIEKIEVDTNHFKGNFPESCALEGTIAKAGALTDDLLTDEAAWVPILPRTKLQAHTRHFYSKELVADGPFTHLRLRIFPDGGVSRLRVHGVVTTKGRENTVLRLLNGLDANALGAELRGVCGSSAWVKAMVASRPYADLPALQKKSHDAFATLSKEDWLEAFRAHPRIGEKKAHTGTGERAQGWSKGEQRAMGAASQATLDAIAEANLKYEARFGHIYIVCATGKSPDELLAIVNERSANDPATELTRAGHEQEKIADLRLAKLVGAKS